MPAEVLLAIETSALCSVAVCTPVQRCSRMQPASAGHSRSLLGMIDEALREAGQTLADLSGILWGHGPGSFTGLRMGAAAVQGLSFTRGIPVTGYSSLHALACASLPRITTSRVATVVDARLGDIYYAVFERHGNGCVRIADDVRLPVAEVQLALSDIEPGGLTVVGDAINAGGPLADWCRTKGFTCIVDAAPTAEALLDLAASGISGTGMAVADACQPVYLRDATMWKKLGEQRPAAR